MVANPLVKFLERRVKLLRKHSSMIIIIGVLTGVIFIAYFAIVKIAEEAVKLATNLPQIYDDFSIELENIGQKLELIINRLSPQAQENINKMIADLTSYVGEVVQKISQPTFAAAGNIAKNVPGMLIAIVMSILSAYFFTADRVKIIKGIERHLPQILKSKILYVYGELKRVVGGYFKAQLKIMVVVYVILVIGLVILKINYGIFVGFLIAFLDMLPFFGTGTILVPWAIIKIFAGDLTLATGLVILYGVTQAVRQIIQPKIVGDSIGMNPMAALFFMYIGYKFYGVLGMIIAVPVGMILINLYRSGVFDTQIYCVKEVVRDFNEFRKF